MQVFTFLAMDLVGDQELEALWDMPSNLSDKPPGYKKGERQLLWKTGHFFRLLRAGQRDIQTPLGLFHSEMTATHRGGWFQTSTVFFVVWKSIGWNSSEKMVEDGWYLSNNEDNDLNQCLSCDTCRIAVLRVPIHGISHGDFSHDFLLNCLASGSGRVHCLGFKWGPGWLADANSDATMGCTSLWPEPQEIRINWHDWIASIFFSVCVVDA